jgi:hypothetical protein
MQRRVDGGEGLLEVASALERPRKLGQEEKG